MGTPTGAQGALAEPSGAQGAHLPEDFVSFQQVVETAGAAGLIRGESGHLDVAPLVAKLTGLNMSRYDLVQDFNNYGWRIVRRASPASRTASSSAPAEER